MSYCGNEIAIWAGQIYTGIGAPTNISVGYISGWLTYSGNLGTLNNRLNTCFYFTGDSPCLVGGFGPQEASIYELFYESSYYFGRANAILAGGDSAPWLSLSEGDSKVTREGTAARAKAYMELYNATNKNLDVAVANWKLGHSIPCTIDGTDLPAWPSP